MYNLSSKKLFLALISWCCCLSEQWGPQSTVWNSPCLGRNLRSKEPSSLWRFASFCKDIWVSLQFIASPPASSRGGGRVGREKMTSIFYFRSASFGIWCISHLSCLHFFVVCVNFFCNFSFVSLVDFSSKDAALMATHWQRIREIRPVFQPSQRHRWPGYQR